MRRAWLSVAMLLAGTGLLVSAGHASGTKEAKIRQGGTLRVNLPETDIDSVDPSMAYGTTSWHIEYSTALKLLNYPDAPGPRGSRLVPEGASSFTVSPDGRTYTFTIRRGFRFSDGSKVTAENYAFAINRALSRDLQSPAVQFVVERYSLGMNISGAQAVLDGTARTAAGVRVHGNKLTVRLTKPNGTFLSIITMPFFQAIPKTLSTTRGVVAVDATHPLPSAGPYYVAERIPNRLVVLEKNPHYAAGVAKAYRRRPANLDQVEIRTAVNVDASYQEVRSNQADYTYSLPRGVAGAIKAEFGLNGRFRVRPTNCISYIAMNSGGTGAGAALFRNNPSLRRAVNYVIDRKAMVELSGESAGLPADQYLPAGFPGFKDIDAYPFTPDLAKARKLAEGHVPSGGPWVYYYGRSPPGPERMELVRRQLRLIGIEIDPQAGRSDDWLTNPPWSKRNSPHAFTTAGWCEDYPDPYDFINTLLYGGSIKDEHNNNIAYFNSRRYDRRMDRAAKLVGPARLRAYERLEHDLVTKAAPWAVWGQPAKQFFFSDSVDMRSFVYQPIYRTFPYNLLALK